MKLAAINHVVECTTLSDDQKKSVISKIINGDFDKIGAFIITDQVPWKLISIEIPIPTFGSGRFPIGEFYFDSENVCTVNTWGHGFMELVHLTGYDFAKHTYDWLVEKKFHLSENTKYKMYTYYSSGQVINLSYLYNPDTGTCIKVVTMDNKVTHLSYVYCTGQIEFAKLVREKYPYDCMLFTDALTRGIWRMKEPNVNMCDITISNNFVNFHYKSGKRDQYVITNDFDKCNSVRCNLQHLNYA
jgi:hypothetical protein